MGRKLLVALAVFFLVVWGLTMLVLRGTVLYAFSDPQPLEITAAGALQPGLDRYAQISGTPAVDLAVSYHRYGVPSYWYMLKEYGGRFILKTDAPLPASAAAGPQPYQGRLRQLGNVAFSNFVVQRFQQERGLSIPPTSYVLVPAESPQTFWPMLLMGAPVTLSWLVVLGVLGTYATRALAGRRKRQSRSEDAVSLPGAGAR